MLAWSIFGLVIVFLVAFWLGSIYGAFTEYDECTSILLEARQALDTSRKNIAEAKRIAKCIDEAILQASSKKN